MTNNNNKNNNNKQIKHGQLLVTLCKFYSNTSPVLFTKLH